MGINNLFIDWLLFYLTTKHTKATKVSDMIFSRLLNFVRFMSFVVKTLSQ